MSSVMALVFISYSRVDSAFVDRLEADLQARGIATWVDRKKLQGGQEWQDQIQSALEHARAVLVVLSPEAVSSRNARTEYRYALSLSKPVIPVLLRPCPQVPMDLNDIQWVSFEEDYNQGLQQLLVALAALPAQVAVIQSADLAPQPAPDELADRPVDLVAAHPAPQARVADLNAIYRQGVRANADGDLEGAAVVWQQVLAQDPNFGGGSLSAQMRELNQRLRPARIQRLRQRAAEAVGAGEWGQVVGTWRALLGIDPLDAQAQQDLRSALRAQAEQAYQRGQWQVELDAWEALLQLEPQDQQAQERMPIATQNQRSAWHYDNARQFLEDGDVAAARAELETLWREAPYYGDPAGLAPAAGVRAPLDYEAAKKQQREAQAAEAAARQQEVRIERGRANRRLMGFSMGSSLVVVVLAGALVLTGLHGLGPFGGMLYRPPTPTPSPTPMPCASASGQVRYPSPSGLWCLDYPTSWTAQPDSNLSNGAYAIVFTPSATSDEGLLVAFFPKTPLDQTGKVATYVLEALIPSIHSRPGVNANSPASIGGTEWTTFDATFASATPPYTVVEEELERDNGLYLLLFFAPTSDYATFNGPFQSVVSSFTFLK